MVGVCIWLVGCGGGDGGEVRDIDEGTGGISAELDEGVEPDGASGGMPTGGAAGGDPVGGGGSAGGAEGGAIGPDTGPGGSPPDAGPTADCGSTCAALQACGVELGGDCVETCSGLSNEAQSAFTTCGARLNGGDCAVDAFYGCLGDDAFAACGRFCEADARCALGADARCLRACVAETLEADPLQSLRLEARDSCLTEAAEDCDAARGCLDVQRSLVPSRDQWCAAYQGCGFEGLFGFSCDDALEILRSLSPNDASLVCAWEILQVEGCPADPFVVIDRCQFVVDDPFESVCEATCAVAAACRPQEVPDADACATACLAGGEDSAARVLAVAECVNAADCPSYEACIAERAPEARCAALCGRRAACEAELDVDACDAACVETYDSVRVQRSLRCEADSPDCASFRTCLPLPAPPCDRYCERSLACGVGGEPLDPDQHAGLDACLDACVSQTLDAGGFLVPTVACVLSASAACEPSPELHSPTECSGPASPGQGCLHVCRLDRSCRGGGDDGLWTCVEACVAGEGGADEALAVAAMESCVVARSPFDAPPCEVLEACDPALSTLDCDAYCAQTSACGAAPPECARACASDPLARVRAGREQACLAEAGADCAAVEACRSYTPVEEAVASEDEVCALWTACGLDNFLPCADLIAIASGGGGVEDALVCVAENLRAGCPDDPFLIFEACSRDGRADETCLELCVADTVCGAEGASSRCTGACRPVFMEERAAEDAAVRGAARRACLAASTCDEYVECAEDSTPRAQCAEYCAALEACGALPVGEDLGACAQACDTRFATDRLQAELECVRDSAGECPAIGACAVPVIDCDAGCERLVECGQTDNRADCQRTCDDAHLADPARTNLRTTCIALTLECGLEVDRCLGGDTSRAEPCARLCTVETGCAARGAPAFTTCMNGCMNPLAADAAIRLFTASPCLLAAPADDCNALSACLEGLPPVPSADVVCPLAAACGVPEDTCVAAVEAPDSGALAAACLIEAARVGLGCRTTAECVGFEPPPADQDCVALCARRAECNFTLDAFLCERSCTPAPPGLAIQRACAEVTRCNGLDACLDLDEQVAVPCAPVCADAVACGAFPDARTCNEVCTGRIRSPSSPADFLIRVDACLAQASAGAVCDPTAALACFAPAVIGGDCAGACEVLVSCGALGEEEAETCAQDCDLANVDDPVLNGLVIDCVFAHLASAVCDFRALEVCVNEAQGAVDPPPDRPDDPPPPR